MKHKNEQSGIIILGIVLGMGLFALGSALVVTSGMISQITKNQNVISGHQTFYTAEAAAREGALEYVLALEDDPYSGGDITLLNSSTEGTITIEELDPDCGPVCGIAVFAFAEDERTRRNVATVVTEFPEGLAFNFATYAENDLSIGGSASINGNVFANGSISFNGNNAEINGDALAAGEINDTDNISGTVYESVTQIPSPQLDFSVYEEEAKTEGTLFDNVSAAEAFIKNKTQNANVYVADTADMNGQGNNTNLTGSLITSGNLTLTGGTYTADPDHVVLGVQGDLTLSGGVKVNGIIYVTGTTTFGAGNNIINGSLISVSGVNATSIAGNTTINYVTSLVEDWYNLQGLDTKNSKEGPRIINWSES